MNFIAKYEGLQEGQTLEFKEAGVQFPNDVWETYSAFANTEGGEIVLGVSERQVNGKKTYQFDGVGDPATIVTKFWNIIRNRQIVSKEVVLSDDVQEHHDDNRTFIVIRVPRADRHDKPVEVYDRKSKRWVAYVRRGEGDYTCSTDELARMQHDALLTADNVVLEDFDLSALNTATVATYKKLLAKEKPSHPWLRDENEDFLYHLRAADRGRDGNYHPTQAGLLAFGNEYETLRIAPHYHLDYREQTNPEVRWNDRLNSMSGDWSGNILDFYLNATQRIDRALPQSFGLADNGMRHTARSDINDAIHEAIANALIHAYYGADASVTVVLEPHRLSVVNSGTFLISPDVAIEGGVTEPRNPILARLFMLIGIVDRAGSGLSKIYTTWEQRFKKKPVLVERYRPDRVEMELPLSAAVLEKRSYNRVSYSEILELCKLQGQVTTKDLVEGLEMKTSTAQLALRNLASHGQLTSERRGRAFVYRLADG